MLKKRFRFFIAVFLLACMLLSTIKTIAQTDSVQTLLQGFVQLKDHPATPNLQTCAINKNIAVEAALEQATQYNLNGNWRCCQQILQALTDRTTALTATEKLQLLLARAAYFNDHQAYDSAYLLATLVNQQATKAAWWPQKAGALLILSSGAIKRRNISFAYAWADSALQLSRKNNDQLLQGKTLLQMALCARRHFTSSSHRAFPYYLQASEVAESIGDSTTFVTSNMYYAADHFEIGQWQEGLPYYQKAIDIASTTSNVYQLYMAYICTEYPLEQQHHYTEALTLLNKALVLSQQQQLPYNIQHIYFEMAEIFHDIKQYDSALHYVNLAVDVPGIDSFWSNAWALKASIYKGMGNYKMATAMYSKAAAWADEDFLYRNQDQLSGYEAKLKTSEKELLVVQEKKRGIQLEWIIGGVVFLFVLSALAFVAQSRSRKKLANQNAIIQKQQVALEQSLSEKDMLLKEIHHRVKNNLSVISSLLELQSSGMEDEKAKAAIAEGQSRVRSIALIHQRLYQHENLAAIEFGGFVNDMIRDVSSVFKIPTQKINTHVQVPETLLDIDTAVPLGLIMNELLTNSFKYGVTADKEGVIDIELTTIRAGNYTLTYFDNGPGMPVDFDLKKTRSLGLRLIHRLSKQIGGEAKYASADGAKFIITFKDSFTRNQEA